MSDKIGFFGAKKAAIGAQAQVVEKDQEIAGLNERVALLTAQLEELGAFELVEIEQKIADARVRAEQEREAAQKAAAELAKQLDEKVALLALREVELTQRVTQLDEAAELQEMGIYKYRHVLSSSIVYKDRIASLTDEIKTTARSGQAVTGAINWTVNNSASQGRKMVREFSKLMLRAYNAEADVLVKNMKPHKLASAIDRLNKSRSTIERLGQTMSISITASYHQLRIRELELTADYINKLAEEKEAEREEKARLREERKAQQEMERERQRLEKEHAHYTNALEQLEAKGDHVGADRLREQLGEIQKAIEDVDYRAANIRAGYVYVISNVGSFGEKMIKVGMTRRLEPMDRVRELSDASVPFNFDVHALFFSEDAVGIERQMHERLADRRVNRVNLRREFFYATALEARDLLKELAGELLSFDETAAAEEFHQSQKTSSVTP